MCIVISKARYLLFRMTSVSIKLQYISVMMIISQSNALWVAALKKYTAQLQDGGAIAVAADFHDFTFSTNLR